MYGYNLISLTIFSSILFFSLNNEYFSGRILCETVRDFITKISDVSILHGDQDLNEKCTQLKSKLSYLLNVLKDEQLVSNSSLNVTVLFL